MGHRNGEFEVESSARSRAAAVSGGTAVESVRGVERTETGRRPAAPGETATA